MSKDYIVVPDGIGALIYLNGGKDLLDTIRLSMGMIILWGPISGTVPFTQPGLHAFDGHGRQIIKDFWP